MSTPTHPEGAAPTANMGTPPSVSKYPSLKPLSSRSIPAEVIDLCEDECTETGAEVVVKEESPSSITPHDLTVSNEGPSSPSAAPHALTDQESGANNTDSAESEDAASDWANDNIPDEKAEASDSEVMTVHGTANGEGSSGVKKGTKRARADSSSPIPDGLKTQKKRRVRTTALQRQAPIGRTKLPLGNGTSASFTATIFIVKLGPEPFDPQFHVHETVLCRSPKLNEEVQKAKAAKRTTKRNFISLMAHNPVAFEQMVEYLYKDKFTLSQAKTDAVTRTKDIRELFSLAKHYQLPGLQKQMVKLFSSSSILSKLTSTQFFDFAEDMYYEEIDHEKGPFKMYFVRVAPTLMRGLDAQTLNDICRMVKMGGAFAEELFKASHQALLMYTTTIKEEDAAMEGEREEESLFVQW